MRALAELSHGLERVAIALAAEGHAVRLIAHELETASAGEREALAVALSYLLRRRALEGVAADGPLADAIEAVQLTLRLMWSRDGAPPRGAR